MKFKGQGKINICGFEYKRNIADSRGGGGGSEHPKKTLYPRLLTGCSNLVDSPRHIACPRLAYVVSLTIALWAPSKAYDHSMLNIGFDTGSRRTCTDQLTGIHLSSGESFLSRDMWIDMVKHQICTRVDDWPSAINCTRCWSPSMHHSDPGGVRNSISQRWKPV